jgi:hypothetical protein
VNALSNLTHEELAIGRVDRPTDGRLSLRRIERDSRMSTLTTIARTGYKYRTAQRYCTTSRLHVIGKCTFHDKVFAGGATLAENLASYRNGSRCRSCVGRMIDNVCLNS